MRAVQVRALGLDALHQVLDNKVFRILVVLALLPVLFTFLVAFKEDQMVVLFGWKRWGYGFFGGAADDARATAIDAFLQLVFEGAGGVFGVLICLVATAFYVPQMIEKGSADVLFHKPLSRWTLYLARYFSGLLFVALASALMAAGTYLGLRLCSGWNDPGILVGAFTLTYVFGLLYPVSMLFGVLTRSPIASILCTLLFLFANGCVVHESWMFKESWLDQQRASAEEGAPDPLEELSPTLRGAALASDVLHFVLPRTGDAKLIAREMRRQVSSLPFEDTDTGVAFSRLPAGSRVVEPFALPHALEAELGPPRFALGFEGDDARLSLHRRERDAASGSNGESTRAAAGALVERLEGLGLDARRKSGVLGARGGATAASVVRWSEGGRDAVVWLFRADDWIYALYLEEPAPAPADAGATPERPAQGAGDGPAGDDSVDVSGDETVTARVDAAFGVRVDARGDGRWWRSWYEQRVGFDAPPRFNLLLSILTSLGFVGAALLVGAWRLRRMDF